MDPRVPPSTLPDSLIGVDPVAHRAAVENTHSVKCRHCTTVYISSVSKKQATDSRRYHELHLCLHAPSSEAHLGTLAASQRPDAAARAPSLGLVPAGAMAEAASDAGNDVDDFSPDNGAEFGLQSGDDDDHVDSDFLAQSNQSESVAVCETAARNQSNEHHLTFVHVLCSVFVQRSICSGGPSGRRASTARRRLSLAPDVALRLERPPSHLRDSDESTAQGHGALPSAPRSDD